MNPDGHGFPRAASEESLQQAQSDQENEADGDGSQKGHGIIASFNQKYPQNQHDQHDAARDLASKVAFTKRDDGN